eukprot:COSAG06_NODE_81637_length_102_cov_102532.333333_1_plen_21_part_01
MYERFRIYIGRLPGAEQQRTG